MSWRVLRILSFLSCALRVWWMHSSLRSCRTRFESSAGYWRRPQWDDVATVLGVWWIARDSAKVEDQVRILARTLRQHTGKKWPRLPSGLHQHAVNVCRKA